MFTLLINKLSVLFFALDLAELYFDGTTGDDTLALGEELLADDAFEEGAFSLVREGRYLLTGNRRLRSWAD